MYDIEALQTIEYHQSMLVDSDEAIQYGALLGKLINLDEVETGLTEEMAQALTISKDDYGLSPPDLNRLVHTLPPGTSAIMGLVEHAWSRNLNESVLSAGGVMLAQGLIEPSALALVKTELDTVIEAAAVMESEGGTKAQATQEGGQAVK